MARHSVQMRLTLLYAGPFLVSGAALLAVPLLGAKHTVTAPANVGGVGSTADQRADIHVPLLASAVGLAIMVVISLVLGWLVAGRFLRPLRTITATARDISASNLHRRLDITGRDDEFTELAETLDDLFQRLQRSFESQRHFVANASHELRTPLTAERTLLQVALADPEATVATLRSTCQDLLTLGAQQERLIDALLTLASSERGIEQRESVDLARIAADVAQSRGHEAGRRGIDVDTALSTAWTTGDPHLVESLVANLVDNALRHNLPGGWVEIATATTAGRAHLTVRNTGPLIPPSELERLFQPFQQYGRERIRSADGYGLGLAIVRAIADAHGATLAPRARPDGGLDVDVSFPSPEHPGGAVATTSRRSAP
jgi:signal transduction histidine kinase